MSGSKLVLDTNVILYLLAGEYNKEIEEAMEEIKRGEVYTHEEVVKMSKNW